MNITKHALMRYCQRKYQETIVSDRTFDMFVKDYPEKVEEARTELTKEFLEAEFMMEHKYEKQEKCRYFINAKTLSTFIVDSAKANMVTFYKIDYGLDEEGNREIYKIFRNSLNTTNDKLLFAKSRIDYKNEKVDDEIMSINLEIEKHESIIKGLRLSKEQLQLTKTTTNQEISTLESEYKVICDKIVRSSKAL
ncbi:MAG: hypothetical protein ACRC92_27005 [Peptostreptococcaceae bacterium]